MTAKQAYTLFCNSETDCEETFTCHSDRADFTRLEAARLNNGNGWRWVWKQAENNRGPALSHDFCPIHRDEGEGLVGKPLSAITQARPTDRIDSFTGSFRFLSNFYKVTVAYEGETYQTSEHAFQAAKCALPIDRHRIRMCGTPRQAKQLGRQIIMRADWPTARLRVMKEILRIKFTNPLLRKSLLLTGTMELIEGNTWGDHFWGVCDGIGENHLGKILMEVRAEIVTSTYVEKSTPEQ